MELHPHRPGWRLRLRAPCLICRALGPVLCVVWPPLNLVCKYTVIDDHTLMLNSSWNAVTALALVTAPPFLVLVEVEFVR